MFTEICYIIPPAKNHNLETELNMVEFSALISKFSDLSVETIWEALNNKVGNESIYTYKIQLLKSLAIICVHLEESEVTDMFF